MDHHLYRNLAQNHLADGNTEAAIDTMKRHLEFDSGALTVAIELAALLVETGRIDEAIETLDRATRSHPDYAEGYLGLAQLLVMSGRRAEALGVVERLQTGFPADRELLDRAKTLVAAIPVATG
jgi:predicted Zn-dependent protease